jgi:hypothetical protein
LALLGVVVPYELAAHLAWMFFGIQVNAMTVWCAVQRLGGDCEAHNVDASPNEFFGPGMPE